MKHAIKKIDRHGKTRWYYLRDGGYWALSGDPETNADARREYDQIADAFSIGQPPDRPMRKRGVKFKPEGQYTREAERAVARAKIRARQWNRSFNLDARWVRDKIAEQRCCCALTGIPFSPVRHGEKRNPYAPSIDRIDSRGGYTMSNVRIVLLSVNLALSDWGEAHFAEICGAYMEKRPALLRRAA